MNNYYEEIIELLDRKYDFLITSSREDFMLDLADFMIFLFEDERIKYYTIKIYQKFTEKQQEYSKTQKEEKERIIKLAKRIRETYPELDDTKTSKDKIDGDRIRLEHGNSFTSFDYIVDNADREKGIPLEPDLMSDDSDVRKLLIMIVNIIQSYKDKYNKQINDDINNEYRSLDEQRTYNFKKWLNSCRISAGNAIASLNHIVSLINPKPESFNDLNERFRIQTSSDMMRKVIYYKWIEDVTYGVISRYSNHKPSNLDDKKIDNIFNKLKNEVKRVYETIREEIGTHLLYKQILNKYKIRCVWYNYEELWELIEDNNKITRKREKLLTLNLAKYLFDNGISVMYRLKLGQHEMDMVNPEVKNPLLIEVKVYKDSNAKSDIIQGIAQLHSYINNISAKRDIKEAYYILYRLGGPLYELPEKIITNQFIINTILIDLGRSDESGRKQSKPIIISEKEILKKIDKFS